MKIGFIGLGMMGSGMAANLQKAGHQLVVHDLRRAAAEPYLAAGAVWADSPRAVAEQSEVVFTSLPGPPEVEAVALGDNGILAGMSRGKAYFDLSTNSPTTVRKIHAVFAEKDVYMLDAPVSGGPRGAAQRRARALGRRRRADLPAPQDGARRAWATRRAMSGRSAPARSPSWCTTAPAMRSRRRSPRCFRSASRPGSSPWPCGRRCATAPSAGGAPSTALSTSSCRGNTTRPLSRSGSPTRT